MEKANCNERAVRVECDDGVEDDGQEKSSVASCCLQGGSLVVSASLRS